MTWTTADEFNVDHFEVERSNNNSISFSKIGTVKANNYFAGSQYIYTDYLPLEGTAFYRIKSVDIDGKTGYTSIVSVSEYAQEKYTIVNPVVNQINLSAFNIYKGIYRYELLTISGQLAQAGSVNLEVGQCIYSINAFSYSETVMLSNSSTRPSQLPNILLSNKNTMMQNDCSMIICTGSF